MTDSIRRIFETNVRLLGDMDKAIYYFREQQYDQALGLVADSIERVNLALEAIIKDREYFNLVDTESMFEMLSGILTAQRNKDYILLADLLELQLVNFLIGVQELIIGKEELVFDENKYRDNISLLIERGIGFPEIMKEPMDTAALLENGYRVEFTSCGLMTLAGENNGVKFYFHTNNKIMTEAFLLARRFYCKDIRKYVIYGFGMGYHIHELAGLAPEAEIEIYEADANVIKLACAFADSTVTELLANGRVKLIFDSDFSLLKERLTESASDESFLVHYPSYKNIRSSEGKAILGTKLAWPDLINI